MRCAVLVTFALGLGGALPGTASAQSGVEAVAKAKSLMKAGRPAEAQSLLQQLALRYPDNNDVDFLLGLLAIDSAHYDQAVRRFREILSRQPSAVRVRLELARTFYLKGDYENAFRNFQFARAGKLPPGVATTIDGFLAAIRQQKRWSYSLSLAVAPDTNINNGTSAREALLFGLPFELGDEIRAKSGIGLSTEAAAEFAPRLNAGTRLRVGTAMQRREYRGSDFDDMTIAFHAGPRIVSGKWDLSLLTTAHRRWFGSRVLSQGIGLRSEAALHLDARTLLSAGAAVQRLRYPNQPFQDGHAFSVSAGAVRAVTPASSINGRVAVSRRIARIPELSNWSGSISAGYYRDIAGGFSLYVEPGYSLARYDAADPFFGKQRKDRLAEIRLAVLNRRILLSRFTPRLGLMLARRQSNIDLYDFKQRRLEIGLTSTF